MALQNWETDFLKKICKFTKKKKNILVSGETSDGPVVSTELHFPFPPPLGLLRMLKLTSKRSFEKLTNWPYHRLIYTRYCGRYFCFVPTNPIRSPRAEMVPPRDLTKCLAQSRCAINASQLGLFPVPSLSLGHMKVTTLLLVLMTVLSPHSPPLFCPSEPLKISLGLKIIEGGAESRSGSETSQLTSLSRVKKSLSPEEK